MDDVETLNRRARLRELIARCFDGKPAELLRHIEARTRKRPNQGELSAIQKDNSGKSFGDKKARALTEQIGLHRRWFDLPLGTNLERHEWMNDSPESIEAIGPAAPVQASLPSPLVAAALALDQSPAVSDETKAAIAVMLQALAAPQSRSATTRAKKTDLQRVLAADPQGLATTAQIHERTKPHAR